MKTVKIVASSLLGLALFVAVIFGLVALGKAVFGQEITDCPVCQECPVIAENGETTSENGVSCVKRMEFGQESSFFTETWDSETRVWIIKQKSACEGPYCFDYSGCKNPEETIRLQPFWLGYERNPVDGNVFRICENFEGDCSR